MGLSATLLPSNIYFPVGYIKVSTSNFIKKLIFYMPVMDYREMLKIGREKLPVSVLKTDRFAIPKVRGHIQGNKTIISNFIQIADQLGREPDHVLKYVLKELATPGEVVNNLLTIGSKVSAERINQKIEQYAQLFVVCKECKKPDTKLDKQDRVTYVRCSACGAKYPING